MDYLIREVLHQFSQSSPGARTVVLPTHFYNQYLSLGYNGIGSWLRRIDIFGEDFVNIVINQSCLFQIHYYYFLIVCCVGNHWSLVVLVRPGLGTRSMNDPDQNRACILGFDSFRGSHDMERIAQDLRR